MSWDVQPATKFGDSGKKPAVHIPHRSLRRAREDFVVVTCVFNPRGFASRYQLYRDFAARCAAAGARLLTVEVALGDRPHEVTERYQDWHVQLRTAWELWHKERALNLGIQRAVQLVPDCRYIAWIDADITFVRPDWVAATAEALQHHAVVQMFGQAGNLTPDEESQWVCDSSFKEYRAAGYHHERAGKRIGGHPGLAWAARRETLDRLGGLLDFAISGSGDSHMKNLLIGQRDEGDSSSTLSGFSWGFLHALRRWGDLCDRYVRGNVGYVPGLVLHHWHGRSQSRGHKARWDAAKHHGFDPATDLIVDCSGLYRLAPGREQMGEDIRRSLSERNEDGIDV